MENNIEIASRIVKARAATYGISVSVTPDGRMVVNPDDTIIVMEIIKEVCEQIDRQIDHND